MNQREGQIALTIDGKEVRVPAGTTVYQAASKMGIELPIFCYQDRMPPLGACRVCLVEVENMGKLQTSCTLQATEGMVVKTQSAGAVEGRKEIMEFLLINHPLDCPICDKGGECPLQENAIRYGPGLSKFFEEKRHFPKALPLSPVLMLDRERCIVCARCTRFGELIAGDYALQMLHRGYKTEVGVAKGSQALSKFIGNTIAICPVGALTSRVYRFRARPWDNDSTKTTCSLCPVGCSLLLDARDGEIVRTRACENPAVNDTWLCDKGWFGYEFVSHPERLEQPLVRRNGRLESIGWEEALTLAAQKIEEARPGGKIAAWGGNPLTTEENYLFQKLFREGMGVGHLDHRIGSTALPLSAEGLPPGMEMELQECEELSYIFLLGLDLTEEFPVVWLRLKQALNRGALLFFMGHFSPEIASFCREIVLHRPGEELEKMRSFLPQWETHVKKEGKGAIFLGSQYLDHPERLTILSELQKVKQRMEYCSLNLMEGKGNSMGARLAGMRPDCAPLGVTVETPGLPAFSVLERAASEGWDLIYVAGADPALKFPSPLLKRARAQLGCLIVQDLFLTETARHADLVFPTLAFPEKSGSFLNIEGRVQSWNPGKEIPPHLLSDGEIFQRIGEKLQLSMEIDPDFLRFLKREGRVEFPKPKKLEPSVLSSAPAPLGGKLAATFKPILFDQGTRMRHNRHLSQLSPAAAVRLHPMEAERRNLVEGSAVCLRANGVEIEAALQIDGTVALGTIVLPLGCEEVPVQEFGLHLTGGLHLEILKR